MVRTLLGGLARLALGVLAAVVMAIAAMAAVSWAGQRMIETLAGA